MTDKHLREIAGALLTDGMVVTLLDGASEAMAHRAHLDQFHRDAPTRSQLLDGVVGNLADVLASPHTPGPFSALQNRYDVLRRRRDHGE